MNPPYKVVSFIETPDNIQAEVNQAQGEVQVETPTAEGRRREINLSSSLILHFSVDLTEEDEITQECFMTRMELIEFGEDAELYGAYLELIRPFERSARPPTPKLDLDDYETLSSFARLDAEYWAAEEKVKSPVKSPAGDPTILIDDDQSPGESQSEKIEESFEDDESSVKSQEFEQKGSSDDEEETNTPEGSSSSQGVFSRFFGNPSQVQSQPITTTTEKVPVSRKRKLVEPPLTRQDGREPRVKVVKNSIFQKYSYMDNKRTQ